ncbi:SHOCT domain-containing protein [Subtercola sp. PAMC28395]|uniref:SHOCT domain-containing protein n=1 Tax=Subtercola sp. PAMC28395 TaxID=2846775 RepID=UPI001C0B46E9|nr:SHOCT domain-containing protein [Subtercola sp. PAMC28395]QWT23782.1 SHOCT domain-containing protein [Subtercola sp. PAMC28395]
MNFWDVVGVFFWSFVFISYLMILFSIIGDLFRNHKTPGIVKAIWFIFLIFVPFLTAFVYLIANGRGMSERQLAAQQSAKKQADDYIRQAAGSSPTDEVAKAKTLLDSGAITQAEFDKVKAGALSRTAA